MPAIAFPPCLSRKRLFQGLSQKALTIFGGSARNGRSSLPVEAKAISAFARKSLRVLGGSVCVYRSTLPVKEKAIPRGQNSGLRLPFLTAGQGKSRFEASKLPKTTAEGCKPLSLSTKRLRRAFAKAPGSLNLYIITSPWAALRPPFGLVGGAPPPQPPPFKPI